MRERTKLAPNHPSLHSSQPPFLFQYGSPTASLTHCLLCHPGPEIWLEYAQYSIGGMGSPGGIEKVRGIFERALTAVGLHMTKGATVWDAFREFENAILSTVQVGAASYLTPTSPQRLNSRPWNTHAHPSLRLTAPRRLFRISKHVVQ